MNDTPSSTPPGASADQWAYQRPDCRGAKALGFFIDDLQKVLDDHTARVNASPAALYAAQADANVLLTHYAQVPAAPPAFAGQSITLKTADNGKGGVQLVPLFSAALKQALVTLLHGGAGAGNTH
jgi:hypothetical protein